MPESKSGALPLGDIPMWKWRPSFGHTGHYSMTFLFLQSLFCEFCGGFKKIAPGSALTAGKKHAIIRLQASEELPLLTGGHGRFSRGPYGKLANQGLWNCRFSLWTGGGYFFIWKPREIAASTRVSNAMVSITLMGVTFFRG